MNAKFDALRETEVRYVRSCTWTIEDSKFWQATGKRIENRNLGSIPALLLAFAVWMVWSVVVAKLPAVGFKFTTDRCSGWPQFPACRARRCASSTRSCRQSSAGGYGRRCRPLRCCSRRSASDLRCRIPSTPYIVFVSLALLCGFGGGNFALLDGHYSSSSRRRRRAMRSRSMPASAISASAWCSSSSRW